jgi:hypothetical protein
MRYIITILCTTFILLSCSKKMQPTVSSIETYKKDSIVVKEKIVTKDTTIYIKGDSVTIYDTIPCPEAEYKKEVISKKGNVTATVDIENGKIHVNCKQDSLQAYITWLETQIIKEKTISEADVKVVEVPVEVPVKYTPKWHWYLHGILFILLLYLFGNPISSFVKHLITKWN